MRSIDSSTRKKSARAHDPALKSSRQETDTHDPTSMGRSRCRGNRHPQSHSRHAERRMVDRDRDRVARSRQSAGGGQRAGHSEGVRLLRGAARRSRPSTRSTTRCPTTSTCHGRSARPRPGSTCSARSRSHCRRRKRGRCCEVRDRTGVQIQEAFMVRSHPQWLAARRLVTGGSIGDLRAMLGRVQLFQRRARRTFATFRHTAAGP